MDYLTARRQAGTPAGDAYAAKLSSMPPDEAAAELFKMFALSASEDVASDISNDLQLEPEVALKIADSVIRMRGEDPDRIKLIIALEDLLSIIPFEQRGEVLQCLVSRHQYFVDAEKMLTRKGKV
jgi:hypothetical protein